MIKNINNWYIYRSKVAYTGTFFEGWQSQPHKNTIQDIIEKVLLHIFKKTQKIQGASRTDSGVHAEGQVFTFQAPLLDPIRMASIINGILPDTIYVFDIALTADNFHPRFSTQKKIYQYKFSYEKQLPAIAPYIHHEKKYFIDIKSFSEYADIFIGEYDFRSFCSEELNKDTIRTIFDISLNYNNNIYEVTFVGNGFLRYMIRRLLGALIECNSKKNKVALMEIFFAQNSKHHLYTMPAKGLILKDIIYNEK